MRPEGDGWISGKAAAERLGTTLEAVYLLVFRKRLRRWEDCTALFVAAADVEALREARERRRAKRAAKPGPPRRKQGRPDGEGWVTVAVATRMLGVPVAVFRQRAFYKRLTKVREGRMVFLRWEEMEALLRDPERLRREGNWERQLGRRRMAERLPFDRVDVRGASVLLGVTPGTVKKFVYYGRLRSYQAQVGHSKHWFLRAEVMALAEELGEKRAERERRRLEEPGRVVFCSRVKLRKPLRRGGTVEVGDLSEWEKYFGEWLTTRQAAWMLHVTQRQVGSLRQSGRLPGRKQPTLIQEREQWHYRKKDVLALRGDAEHIRRYQTYCRYATPEGRARREEERRAATARQLEICASVVEQNPPGRAIAEFLRKPMLLSETGQW